MKFVVKIYKYDDRPIFRWIIKANGYYEAIKKAQKHMEENYPSITDGMSRIEAESVDDIE